MLLRCTRCHHINAVGVLTSDVYMQTINIRMHNRHEVGCIRVNQTQGATAISLQCAQRATHMDSNGIACPHLQVARQQAAAQMQRAGGAAFQEEFSKDGLCRHFECAIPTSAQVNHLVRMTLKRMQSAETLSFWMSRCEAVTMGSHSISSHLLAA